MAVTFRAPSSTKCASHARGSLLTLGRNSMSQQSELADWAYARLSDGPFPASNLVRMVREKWDTVANPQAVHFFVSESLACLLRNEDVEVGDIFENTFVPWTSAPWESEQRIEDELCNFEDYLEDVSRYVFRKKN